MQTSTLRILALAAPILAIFLAASAAQAMPTKRALLVANSDYLTLPDLVNPPLDVKRIGNFLENQGFSVSIENNVDADKFRSIIRSLPTEAQSMEEGSVLLFYYAGHGFEVNNTNYIIPIDAALNGNESKYVSLSQVLESLSESVQVSKIIILDACRSNIPGETGFVRESPPANTLVAFSTELQNSALDGEPGAGSPFANAFLAGLANGGSPTEILSSTQESIKLFSEDKQRPVYYTNLSQSRVMVGDVQSDTGRLFALAAQASHLGLRSEAIALARRSAEGGNTQAMVALGKLLSESKTPKERKEAEKWYKAAGKSGNRLARLSWARWYAQGHASLTDTELSKSRSGRQAIQVLRTEAINGSAAALQSLGFMLSPQPVKLMRIYDVAERLPIVQSQEAGSFSRRAHAAGSTIAIVDLADQELGQGNVGRAVEMYRLARGQGLLAGWLGEGRLLTTFGERKRDARRDARALRLYSEAAKFGNGAYAAAPLAIFYALGIGTEKDSAKSLAWAVKYRDSPSGPLRFKSLYNVVVRQILDAKEVIEPSIEKPSGISALLDMPE